MTLAIKDIGWASYGGYEGPRYLGSKKFVLPVKPTFDQKVMSVISASEGNASSINMYDRAIISVGFIQWIELGQYSVSDMIGYVAETVGIEIIEQKLGPAMTMAKASFKKTAQGRWRFHILDNNAAEVPVVTETLSRYMFARSSGKIGTWTEVNKLWAKCWAACIAELFEDDRAVAAQVEWTVPQLKARFVGSQGRSVVFEQGSPSEGYGGALKALLIAYGVNLPAVAERIIAQAIKTSKFPKWSKQWCLDLMHALALTSGVSLWPGRYDAKRPAMEKAFNIVLPKNNAELAQRKWTKEPIEMIGPDATVEVPVVDLPVERPANVIVVPVVEDVVVRPDRPVAQPQAPKGFWGTIRGFSDGILEKMKLKK